jgi:hypothetical protein
MRIMRKLGQNYTPLSLNLHVRTRPRTRRVRNPTPCICNWLFTHMYVTVMPFLCSHTPLGVDVQGIEASQSAKHSSQEQVLCCPGRCPRSGHVLSLSARLLCAYIGLRHQPQ